MKDGHAPIVDPDVSRGFQTALRHIKVDNISHERWCMDSYTDEFVSWIKNSNCSQVNGLDSFPTVAYSSGTLESIQSFLHRHGHMRRLRFSEAEFVGSKIIANHAGFDWCFLEQGAIDKNDAVIMSFPFSGNGDRHPDFDRVLDQCDVLGVPVLLDMAYFVISNGIKIDVDRHCITDVTFSLSKAFSAQLRLGIRFCREYHDDMVQVNSDLKMINRLSATIGTALMHEYSHDWLVSRYLPRQMSICARLDIQPTSTMTLAMGDPIKYPQFIRAGYCRICITDELLKP